MFSSRPLAGLLVLCVVGEHGSGTCTSHNFPEGGAAVSFQPGPPRLWAAEVASADSFYKLSVCCVTEPVGLKRIEVERRGAPALNLFNAIQLL